MKRLYYLGQPGDGYGWGVANANLIKALREVCEVVIAPASQPIFDAPVFAPIGDVTLKPTIKWKAPKVIGYCFTEWPLPEEAERNARIYDVLFAGSTWNMMRLRQAGIKQAEVLLQGIDAEVFKSQPWSERKGFVVFSGGKYEFRKGQDYVLAAMRSFMAHRHDVTLLAAWHNPWQESMASMQHSWLIDPLDPFKGIPMDRIFLLPPVQNHKTPQFYAQAHIGLFPNRCEAGTNLVMCEFMASGRPVIASNATGQKDIFETAERSDYLLLSGSYDPAGWFNPNVSDIITHLEHAYQHREELEARGQECRRLVAHLTWRDCAEKICKAAFGT